MSSSIGLPVRGLRTTTSKFGFSGIEATFGRWDVTIESTIGGSRETLIGLDGLQLAESVYRTVHRDVMTAAHARQWTRLHAALVDCNGVRVAIAGHSGAGKTTLALALALRGAQLRADEGVFIRGTDRCGPTTAGSPQSRYVRRPPGDQSARFAVSSLRPARVGIGPVNLAG